MMRPQLFLSLSLSLVLVNAVGACGAAKSTTGSGTASSSASSTSGAGGASSSATSTSTSTSSSSSSSGTGGSDPTVAQCATCLDTKCAAEKTACDAECYAIQACLDAVCFHLSATSAPTEGACQVYCQGLHPTGKPNHLAYVNCASSGMCNPPCAGAPYDFEQCVTQNTVGSCKAQSDACNNSSDCKKYEACAASCATFPDCQACGSGTSGAAGEKTYEALQLCLAHSCLAQEWLPNM